MIDLFSDTHTLPTDGMRAAMANAEVGDEQLGEDPSTRRLEERIADLTGTEAALFLISGSMANKVAIAATTRPGDAVVCDHRSHLYRFEGGGPAALFGVMFELIVTDRGHFTPEQLAAVMNPGNPYQPRTSVVFLEQTHNFAGGTVWALDQYEAVCAVARDHGAAVVTDGARLLNAVAASGVPADRWAAPVDAIWIDFSKGLGAPGGAAIAGSADFIQQATRFKYLLGGAMRQSGILAAAALYGLDHHAGGLVDDQHRATDLAAGLRDLGLEVADPESNMVFCHPPTGMSNADFVTAMAEAGVRVSATAGRIRMVTHLGVDDTGIAAAIAAAARIVNG